jgi:uncharacterized surface protein with fasciclin (FAS1) repeats
MGATADRAVQRNVKRESRHGEAIRSGDRGGVDARDGRGEDECRADQAKDIVDTAVGAGSFTTLRKGAGGGRPGRHAERGWPFTVFAPTDEAFAKLPAGTLENLLKPENKAQLRRILTYHVVSGKVMAADVVKLKSAKAVSGDAISVSVTASGVMVNRSQVVKTDIAATNGVIHVIDTVLMPAGK